MFATFSPPQRIKHFISAHNQIVPRDARQGLAPAHNTFPMFKHCQSFKKYPHAMTPFFYSNCTGYVRIHLVFVSLPGVDYLSSGAD